MLTQTDMVSQAMVLCVQHAIIYQFADAGGNITWDEFASLIQKMEHQKVSESANTKKRTSRNEPSAMVTRTGIPTKGAETRPWYQQ